VGSSDPASGASVISQGPGLRSARSSARARLLLVLLAVPLVFVVAFGLSGQMSQVWPGFEPVPVTYLAAAFDSDATAGWGTTDVPGVSWAPSAAPGVSWRVEGGTGQAVVSLANTSHHQTASGLKAMTDQEVTGRLRVDVEAASAVAHQGLVWLRYVDTATAYRMLVYVPTSGNAWALRIERIAAGTVTALTERKEIGVIYGRTGFVRFRFRAERSSPTHLFARLWQDERTEPTEWTVTATDGAAPLQPAVRSFRLTSFVDTNQTELPVTFYWDDIALGNGVASAP